MSRLSATRWLCSVGLSVLALASSQAQAQLFCPSSNTCSIAGSGVAYSFSNSGTGGAASFANNSTSNAAIYASNPSANAGYFTSGSSSWALQVYNSNGTAVRAQGAAGAGIYASTIGNSSTSAVIGDGSGYGARGIYGTSSANNGVYGVSSGASGVFGTSSALNGVEGQSSNGGASGVYGYNSGGGIGVAGRAISSPNGIGVYGDRNGGQYAGYFYGNTHVNGTLSKSAGSFKIDHPLDPENKFLSHSFVESPDMKNIYDGIAVFDQDGKARVEMPLWFSVLNRDFRYQLTSIGQYSPVYIAEELSAGQFLIAGGRPGQRVSWQVTGIRQDAYANAHRIPVEEMKQGIEKGRYMNPEAFGKPESAGIGAALRPQPPSDAPEFVQPLVA